MIQRASERLRIDVHLNDQDVAQVMAEDVRRGLTSNPKYLLPKYFYDDAGSDLFERITALPEYYLTRTEAALLTSIAQELMDHVDPQELVELGSGSSTKTRLLLEAWKSGQGPRRYVPFDVSSGIVEATAASLQADYPWLHIHGVIGDFERHLDRIPTAIGRRLVLFLGSTLGNLDPPARLDFLVQVGRLLGSGDRLLLGVDLVKDVSVLEAAYNDAAGVTAEFNRNILRVINRGLEADFLPEAFQHRALYNRDADRIEMHLVPESDQTVHVKKLDLTVTVGPGETLSTESSYKFTRESTAAVLQEAGMALENWYTDPQSMFGLALATPTPGSR